MLAWASSIGAYNKQDSCITHVITSGGGYFGIPDDKHGEFQQQYAAEKDCTDRIVTLTELPSDGVFPMFFKVIHVHKDGLTKEGVLQICGIVVGVFARYYPEAEPALFESVVYPSSSEEVSLEGSKWIKTSFGLAFYNLFVTKQNALQIRHTVVCELHGQLGSLECAGFTWSDSIAREPYTTGMEMYGCARSVPCTMCMYPEPVSGAEQGALREAETKYVSIRKKIRHVGAGFDYSSHTNVNPTELKSQEFSQIYLELMSLRGGKTCIQCAGTGVYVDKNQSPLPAIAIDGRGQESTAATELLTRINVIRKTTTRAPETQKSTPGFSRPISVPMCPPAGTADALRRSGDLRMKRGMTPCLMSEAASSDLHTDDLRGLRLLKKDHEVTDRGVVRDIQHFIRTRMGLVADEKRYANIWVTNVYASISEKKAHEKLGKKMIDRMLEASNSETTGRTTAYNMDKLWIRVTGDGSSFCGNRGYHATSSIFFEMGPDKCWQRCFSSDDIPGSSLKTCSEYSTGDRGGQRLSLALLKFFKLNSGSSQPDPVMPTVHAIKKQRVLNNKGKRGSKETQKTKAFWSQFV